MATFNSGEEYFNKKVQTALNALKAKNEPLVIGANSSHRLMAQRIFEKGENTQGTTFNYVSSEYRERKRKFGRGKGRETSFVNFTFTGDLKFDFANGLKKVDIETFIVQLKRSRNVEVAGQLSDRFGGVSGSLFDLNEEEKDNFVNIVQLEYERLFS